MFNSLPMHIRNITACPPSVFKKQLNLHLSPMLDCPCTPKFNNSLDNKLYYVVSLRVTRLTKSQLNNQKKKKSPFTLTLRNNRYERKQTGRFNQHLQLFSPKSKFSHKAPWGCGPQFSGSFISISLSHHLVRMANTHNDELRPSAHQYGITDKCPHILGSSYKSLQVVELSGQSDLQIVVNTSLQTVSLTVFQVRVSLQRLS